MNVRKLVAFAHSNDKHTRKEIKETVSFITALKKNLGVSLTKQVMIIFLDAVLVNPRFSSADCMFPYAESH